MNKKIIYICYGENGLIGHLIGESAKEIREKIVLYNTNHKDKIVKFKNPIKKRTYEVRQ